MLRKVPKRIFKKLESKKKLPCRLEDIGFGKKPLNTKDFRQLCKQEEIIVKRFPLVTEGCYLHYKGYKFIIIKNGLKGKDFLEVAYHELGHHFLHSRQIIKFSSWFNPTKKQRKIIREIQLEADAFAWLALNP